MSVTAWPAAHPGAAWTSPKAPARRPYSTTPVQASSVSHRITAEVGPVAVADGPSTNAGAALSIGTSYAGLNPMFPARSAMRKRTRFQAAGPESCPNGTEAAVTVSTPVLPSVPVHRAGSHPLQVVPPSVEKAYSALDTSRPLPRSDTRTEQVTCCSSTQSEGVKACQSPGGGSTASQKSLSGRNRKTTGPIAYRIRLGPTASPAGERLATEAYPGGSRSMRFAYSQGSHRGSS